MKTVASLGDKILLTGDASGLINVFGWPDPSCEQAISFSGHTEYVTKV